MSRLGLVGTVLLAISACDARPVTASSECAPNPFASHPKHARYVALLEQGCRATSAPGCIVFVDRAGEPPWAGSTGFANLSTGAPLCIDAPLRVGSVSKTWVAAMTLQLVEAGRLSLDDTLAARLPRVASRIPSSDRITVEHLLGHRSGLLNPERDVFVQTDYFDRPATLAAWSLETRLERFVYDRPLVFDPGSDQRYSNPGYDLLGLVLEAADEAPLEDILQRRIRTPLGLKESSFERRDDPAIPRGYVETGEGLFIDVTPTDLANVNTFSPSGGLVSTVTEVGTFWRALFGGRLVSPESLEVMQRGTGANRQGLFALELPGGIPVVGHQGALVGQSTWALYVPSEDTVIVFSITREGAEENLAALPPFLE